MLCWVFVLFAYGSRELKFITVGKIQQAVRSRKLAVTFPSTPEVEGANRKEAEAHTPQNLPYMMYSVNEAVSPKGSQLPQRDHLLVTLSSNTWTHGRQF